METSHITYWRAGAARFINFSAIPRDTLAHYPIGSILSMRYIFKRTIKNIFLLLTIPLFVFYLALSFLGNKDGTFQSFSQAISLLPGKFGVYFRAAFYRMACTNTSDDITVGFLTVLSHQDTTISERVYIGPQSNIGKCSIGANTLIGSGVHILSGSRQHSFSNTEKPIQEQGGHYQKVRIGIDCWLGNSAIVMCDLNDHSIVAAGAVVSRPLQEIGNIVAGNPAKIIGNRNK